MDPASAGPVSRMIEQAQKLTGEAGEASERAGQALDNAAQQEKAGDEKEQEDSRAEARKAQEEVGRKLAELAGVLDEGRDTSAARAALGQLMAAQEGLAKQTKDTMPRTVGKKPDELSPEEKQAIKDIAERQAALAKQAEELLRQMQASAAAMSKPDASPSQQAASQSLQEAAQIAQKQGLTSSMQKSSSKAQENQLSQAGQSQQSSMETMKQMMEEMDKQDQRRQEVLRRKLMQLEEAIAKLIEQQKAINERTAKGPDIAGQSDPQGTTRRNTLAVEQEARAGDDTTAAANHLSDAGARQGEAVNAIEKVNRTDATGAQALALTSLDAALKEVQKKREDLDQKEREKNRKRLREMYEQFAARELALREETAKMAALAEPTRQERARIIGLGHKQADLQAEIGALRNEVSGTTLFRHLHGRIDTKAQSVASQLRAATANDETLEDQDAIVSALRTMAAALKDPKRDDPFAGNPGGGGGGGGGGKQPLIPPAAELRLLRGLQQDLYDRTRKAAQQTPELNPTTTQRRRIMSLSAEQLELSELGKTMIEQMQQQMQGPGGPGEPGGAE